MRTFVSKTTFLKNFENAYKHLLGGEKERVRFIKASGYDTYSDMIHGEMMGDDPSVLREASSDCLNAAGAYRKLAYLASNMAKALDKQADKLDRAADRVGD